MNLREAAQQALEALEGGGDSWRLIGPAIDALKAALEQPEPRNQCGETCERAKLCAICARGLEQSEQCRYPDCVDNGPEGKCIRWLTGECDSPKGEQE